MEILELFQIQVERAEVEGDAGRHIVSIVKVNKTRKVNLDGGFAKFAERGIFKKKKGTNMSAEEYKSLRFQIGSLKRGKHSKYPPLAFTEQGVSMLSGILRSKRAVEMNISIMRAFVRMRQYLLDTRELANKFRELERKLESHDKDIASILDAMRQLMVPPPATKKKIGFQHIK